jgi:hypothetical protein
VKVVYIASAAHSGSTLLDLMLNGHSGIVTVGEIKQLPRFVGGEKARKRCTCGAPSILECPFWSNVNAVVAEKSGGRTLRDLNIDTYRDVESFRRDNRLLFEAVGAVSGVGIVVDSSKDAARMQMLLDTPGLELLPIFLARNPKGQILSLFRSGERKARHFGGLPAMIGNYSRQNGAIHRILLNRPHLRIRYEELVRCPERILSSVMLRLGVEYEPQQLRFADHERHNVGGNRMRRQGSSELRLDEAWRRDLTLFQKVTIDIGTLPGRYAFRRLRGESGRQE